MHCVLNPAEMSAWLSNWGYQGVFVCIFIGNLGIPIPEELVLLVARVLAGREALNLGTSYIVAILSAVTGDCCGFLVGRTGGRQAFEWLVRKFPCLQRRYRYLQSFFQKHGNSAVFFARFVTGALHGGSADRRGGDAFLEFSRMESAWRLRLVFFDRHARLFSWQSVGLRGPSGEEGWLLDCRGGLGDRCNYLVGKAT